MKKLFAIYTISALLITAISGTLVQSQVPVERSRDKVVISGVTYYIHQVKKGETSYSISRAYGITVDDLVRDNPSAAAGINTGQTLRIPYKTAGAVPDAQVQMRRTEHDDAKFLYHILKPGETIYFLSRTYSVTEDDIIRSNPGIDITKLSVGTEIAIPRKDTATVNDRKTEPQILTVQVNSGNEPKDLQDPNTGKGYILYKIRGGESLSSIADKYGLSVRELRKANRDVRFPQEGDYIKIPGVVLPEKLKPEIVPADTSVQEAEPETAVPVRPEGFTEVRDLSGSLDVAVLLPFYLRENSIRTDVDSASSGKGRKTIRITAKDDDWIYPRSLDFVEMYEGILLAADTLRSLGVNLNIHTWDIKGDTVELTRIIRAGKLRDMDLIIGPVYSNNLSIVASYAGELGIPVVSPVPLYNTSVLRGNPTVFLASSSLSVAQKALSERIARYPGANIVFVHADTLGTDEDVKNFRSLILSELTRPESSENVRFRDLPFDSRSVFNSDSVNRLGHTMSENSKNIIVIASEDAPVISKTLIDVHNVSRKFDISVFGYPVIRDIDNLDPKYLFDLDILLYYPSWIDYSRENVVQFNSDFRRKFLTEPAGKSYAWQGYDIAYYFISGLAQHGRQFLTHPEIHHPELLQTDFDFVHQTADDGFENHNLYLIRYSKDYNVKVVDGNDQDLPK